MTYCAHGDEIEELAMGFLTGALAARARAHLATCETCTMEHQQLVEERALFARRAEAVGSAPYLAPAVLDAVVVEVDTERRATLARVARAFLAVAACIGAIASTGWIHRGLASVECPREIEPDNLSAAASSTDEPLSCAQPVSGFVRVAEVRQSRDEGLACIARDRATCEEPSVSGHRATSSVATP